MMLKLLFTEQADRDLSDIENSPSLIKRFKAVRKALGYLEQNPRHPILNTHKYTSLSDQLGREVFEAYAENKTPAAYRIFWYYGSDNKEITIIAITPHPSICPLGDSNFVIFDINKNKYYAVTTSNKKVIYDPSQ